MDCGSRDRVQEELAFGVFYQIFEAWIVGKPELTLLICSKKQYKAAAALLLVPGVVFLLPIPCRLAVVVTISPRGLGCSGDPSPAGDGKAAETQLWVTFAQETRPSSPAARPLWAGVCPCAGGHSGALSPFLRQQGVHSPPRRWVPAVVWRVPWTGLSLCIDSKGNLESGLSQLQVSTLHLNQRN